MRKQQFFIRSPQIKHNAMAVVNSLIPDEKRPLVVEIKPLTRTLEQNAKLHAMLSDIAEQCEYLGKPRTLEQWKLIFVSSHTKATKDEDPEIVPNLEGEMINLRESTAIMGVKRLASLIEYIQAWAAENGVRLSDKQGYYGR